MTSSAMAALTASSQLSSYVPLTTKMLIYGFYECGAGECGAGFSRVTVEELQYETFICTYHTAPQSFLFLI